jgi:hypothetical protein
LVSAFLRKYNVALDLATAGSLRIRIPIRKAGSADYATGSDWTPAAGDVKVAKDGGAQANIGTLPTYSNGSWEFTLSATELSARLVEVRVVDSATKAIDDAGFNVETFGHTSAMFPTNYAGGSAGNMLSSGSGTDQVNPSGGKVPATIATGDLADIPAARAAKIDNLDSRLTAIRAGYLDNLSGGAVALESSMQSALTAISNLNNLSALANLYGSPLLEIPDAGSTSFAFTLVVRDNEGKLVDLDASPTIAAANAAGTDRSANLSAVAHPSTGRYTFTYAVAAAAAEESLRITCSGTVSGEARYVEWIGAVVDYDSITTLAAIKAKTDNLPASPAATSDIPSAAAVRAEIDSNSTQLAAIVQDTGTDLPATLAAMQGATFDEATDSLEAIRDRGDAAWTTGGGGGGGGSLTVDQDAKLTAVYNKTQLLGTGAAVTVVSSFRLGGLMELYLGADYLTSLGTSLDLLDADGSRLPAEGSAVKLQIVHGARDAAVCTVTGTVVDPGDGSLIARFDVSRTSSASLLAGADYKYFVYEVLGAGSDRKLELVGSAHVLRGLTAAA